MRSAAQEMPTSGSAAHGIGVKSAWNQIAAYVTLGGSYAEMLLYSAHNVSVVDGKGIVSVTQA